MITRERIAEVVAFHSRNALRMDDQDSKELARICMFYITARIKNTPDLNSIRGIDPVVDELIKEEEEDRKQRAEVKRVYMG